MQVSGGITLTIEQNESATWGSAWPKDGQVVGSVTANAYNQVGEPLGPPVVFNVTSDYNEAAKSWYVSAVPADSQPIGDVQVHLATSIYGPALYVYTNHWVRVEALMQGENTPYSPPPPPPPPSPPGGRHH